MKDIELKSKLVKEFCIKYPDIVSRMRNCLHSLDGSASGINDYHIEGDVWSHTLLVLSEMYVEGDIELKTIMYDLCLLHDVGKIYTRCCYPPYVAFKGHGPAGVQFAIDFIYDKYGPNYLEVMTALDITLPIINNHYDYYKIDSQLDLIKLVNNNKRLAEKFELFMKADHSGRLFTDEHTDYVEFPKVWSPSDYRNPDIVVYSGIPGSGKDHCAKLAGYKILSYDQIRIDEYTSHNNTDGLSEKEIYERAYEYCNKKRVNMDKKLVSQAKMFFENESTPETTLAICCTNLNRKKRTSLVEQLRKAIPDCIIESLFIAAPLQFAVANDLNRKDKTVSEKIVRKFAYSIDIPTMLEGFDKVSILVNESK